MSNRHSIIPASYLILIKKGKILLSKRKNTGYKDNEYSLNKIFYSEIGF